MSGKNKDVMKMKTKNNIFCSAAAFQAAGRVNSDFGYRRCFSRTTRGLKGRCWIIFMILSKTPLFRIDPYLTSKPLYSLFLFHGS